MVAAIKCDTLNTVDNGTVQYNDNTTDLLDFGTDAIHSCNEGFFLVGNSVRICTGNGSSILGVWTGSQPNCSGSSI